MVSFNSYVKLPEGIWIIQHGLDTTGPVPSFVNEGFEIRAVLLHEINALFSESGLGIQRPSLDMDMDDMVWLREWLLSKWLAHSRNCIGFYEFFVLDLMFIHCLSGHPLNI